jgi:hypothetical protein
LGPYNDSFVKTEVEVSESKIDAIRDTVNEMKRYGVHVNLKTKNNILIRNLIGCNRQLVN